MEKTDHYLCVNCECEARYRTGERVFDGEKLQAIWIDCDVCEGEFIVIVKKEPELTSEEANFNFQQIPIEKKEDGRKGKKGKKK